MTSPLHMSKGGGREGWGERIWAAGQVALKAFGKSQVERVMYGFEHGHIKMSFL